MSEDKLQRSIIGTAGLVEEVRKEQELSQSFEKAQKLLESQVTDVQRRLDDAEQNALKNGKKAINKMEERVGELSSELDAENRRFSDTQKKLRRSERYIKELIVCSDEDRKNNERMQLLIDQLQGKIKAYKTQMAEAQEIAAINLSKYHAAKTNVDYCATRADMNELTLAKCRAQRRSTSLDF